MSLRLNRRNFVKAVIALGASAFLSTYKSEVVKAIQNASQQGVKLVWIQGQGDSACTVSLLQASDPDIYDAIEELKVSVMFQPTIMPEFGDDAIRILETTTPDILVVEGSIPTGDMEYACTFGERNGEPVTMAQWVRELSAKTTTAIVGFGSCASFGGIPSAKDFEGKSPTNAVGLYQFFKDNPKPNAPVINIPGCPGHPDWLMIVLAGTLLGATIKIDELGRPKMFFSELIHDNCARRGYYDEGWFAKSFVESDMKYSRCLYKLGCRGPVTFSACARTKWNGGVNVCMNAGAPCIGCMHPEFPDAVSPFFMSQRALEIEATKAFFTGLTGAVLAGAAAYIGIHAYKEKKLEDMKKEDDK